MAAMESNPPVSSLTIQSRLPKSQRLSLVIELSCLFVNAFVIGIIADLLEREKTKYA
jgi:hypothetical protein